MNFIEKIVGQNELIYMIIICVTFHLISQASAKEGKCLLASGKGKRRMNNRFIKNKVSIVTPVLNGEKYLSRMLDSVLEQSYVDLEMILVDGGSSDGTMALAEKYQEKFRKKGMTYHVVAGHGNAAAGMNQGFPFVRGEFLIWPDGDDVLEKDSIKKRVEFLQTHLQYQGVRSLGYYVQEQTEERARPDEALGDLENENLFFPILFSETFVCCGCYMFRSECFFDIYPGREIPESDIGRNLQMLLPFTYHYPCPTIKEELYRVYIRPGSMSRIPLTEEQEEKKEANLEKLVDTIVGICQITDRTEIKKVEAWRARTQYSFNLKFNRRCKAAVALLRVYQNDGISLWKLARGEVYVFCKELISYIRRFTKRKNGKR